MCLHHETTALAKLATLSKQPRTTSRDTIEAVSEEKDHYFYDFNFTQEFSHMTSRKNNTIPNTKSLQS